MDSKAKIAILLAVLFLVMVHVGIGAFGYYYTLPEEPPVPSHS